MFCIFYALFGVPLILITVADIGKFLSENIVWLYTTYSEARKRVRNRRGKDSETVEEKDGRTVKERFMEVSMPSAE